MDSLSQLSLGAAIGEALLGRTLGSRALLLGAVFGTLPDLDVVITPFVDVVGFLEHHRGASHALPVLLPLSVLLAAWFRKSARPGPEKDVSFGRWLVFLLLVFVTHVGLDCFTSYGTLIYWPLSDERVSWSSIFIIDPLYTVPLLLGLLPCLWLDREFRGRRVANSLGLLLSTLYLGWSLAGKSWAEEEFRNEVRRQGIEASRLMTGATPFNTILWHAVVEVDDGYLLGWRSMLDETREVRFLRVKRRAELLEEWRERREVERLIWFADGYYAIERHEEGLIFHVLKFGRIGLEEDDGTYPFSYLIREDTAGELTVSSYDEGSDVELSRRFAELWERIRGE